MHNNFVYVITWYLSFTVRKTGAASWSSPKWLASRIGPPNSQCSGAAPGKVMNLKFSGNVPNLVLGKVRKFQHRSFSGFGDIPEKPEGWIKTTPPATNRVNHLPHLGGINPSPNSLSFSYLSLTFGGVLRRPVSLSDSPLSLGVLWRSLFWYLPNIFTYFLRNVRQFQS